MALDCMGDVPDGESVKKTVLELRLREALRLLERVPGIARQAAHDSGNNTVPFVLHAKIEPFVDETRALLRKK